MIMRRRTLSGSPIALQGRERFTDRIRRITAANLKAASMKVTEMNPENARWYCLHVKSGKEFDVENALTAANVEAFMPRERVVLVRHGRKIESERPFFPSYLLVRLVPTPEAFHGLRYQKDVLDFVGGPAGYHVINDADVVVFKRLSDGVEAPRVATDKSFRDGDQADIVLGPFAGFRCVVTAVKWCRQAKASVRIDVQGRPFDIESMPLAFLRKL
ncbi:transcription termination/antitermination protein NusG [Sinorhizobium meliloti]|uniref:transcription termination/antitermination protein NusG n=1 Tax=Rhizobium meliloti TaxID=382 RepID=UPI000FD330B7|nr:transcription termination/antitermination NusG family protein [Sinorhizobium meliloti]RVN87830.1 antitermination protein NusG [Sinorhizobium meliloti]RVO57864.1 antitermination protein NusG [Sinorhizobium meliloti]